MEPLTKAPELVASMTLRDWFAGMALAGGLATDFQNNPVKEAYALADEMLKRRSFLQTAAQTNERRDPLRNNPVVGFMSEAQAEGILAEMRANNE
jgi:hypothetical protein